MLLHRWKGLNTAFQARLSLFNGVKILEVVMVIYKSHTMKQYTHVWIVYTTLCTLTIAFQKNCEAN